MNWESLTQLVMETYHEWSDLEVPFTHDEIKYTVIGSVSYDTIAHESWYDWDINVQDIYLRTPQNKMAMKISLPDEDLTDSARIALRDDANERAIEAGHIVSRYNESKNYDELRANFVFRGISLCAYGDVTLGLNEAEVKLYAILDEDGDEIDRPLPEIIRDAQYALQDRANELARG